MPERDADRAGDAGDPGATPEGARRRGRLYGRRLGHALRAGQQTLIDERLPRLTPPSTGPVTPASPRAWMEIGFGGGEHLAGQMRAHPDKAFIGAEPFLNGMASLLAKVPEADDPRLLLWNDDARLVLERLEPGALERVFLLFPDPWPKKRHHKRRFVGQDTLTLLGRALAPGGEFRVATDIADYARWTLIEVARHGLFRWTAARAADWREAPADHVPTRYERKARAAGRAPYYLRFARP